MPQIGEYLRNRRWQGIELEAQIIREHVETLLEQLDLRHPNFSIGLLDDTLPFGGSIIGQEVVLLTYRQYHMLLAGGWTISGIEMTGSSVVKTFSQVFDRTWGKREVIRNPAEVRAWFMSQL